MLWQPSTFVHQNHGQCYEVTRKLQEGVQTYSLDVVGEVVREGVQTYSLDVVGQVVREGVQTYSLDVVGQVVREAAADGGSDGGEPLQTHRVHVAAPARQSVIPSHLQVCHVRL